jgi:hypothetical protein
MDPTPYKQLLANDPVLDAAFKAGDGVAFFAVFSLRVASAGPAGAGTGAGATTARAPDSDKVPLLELKVLETTNVPLVTMTGRDPLGDTSAFVTDATASVFEGIPAAPHEDSIATIVADALALVADVAPNEITIVHRNLHDIVARIRKAAAEKGVPCRKVFCDEMANSRKRPDFIVTLPSEHEQDPSSSNHDFYLEAKAVKTKKKSTAELMRDGIAQAVKYSVRRREDVGPTLRHGLAVVSNCIDITFLRINFALGAPHRYKVLLTTKGLSIRMGDGLRYLIRLLCQPVDGMGACDAYGWPRKHHNYEPNYIYKRVLGSGGFADVCCVTRVPGDSDEPDGRELALKAIRRRNVASTVASEAEVLRTLEANKVSGVPRVVDVTAEGWLVTAPVGVPLRLYLCEVPEGKRQGTILEVIRQVNVILCAAHDAGIVHGDVRPSNIVVVRNSDGSITVVLVDWGISVSVSTRLDAGVLAYRRGDFGTPACAEDDFTALGVTFIALQYGNLYSVPWEHAFCKEDMRAERSEWISSRWATVAEDVKEALPEAVLAAINGLVDQMNE